MKTFSCVQTERDDEAKVWVASDDDVAGLGIEAAMTEGLITKLKVTIPEMMVMNTQAITRLVAFVLLSRRVELTG
jgi:Domain of unknown function (DUF1902)